MSWYHTFGTVYFGGGSGGITPPTPDPVSYVAVMDGSQAWEVQSKVIDIDDLDGLELKGKFPDGTLAFFGTESVGGFHELRLFNDGGQITIQLGGNFNSNVFTFVPGYTVFSFYDDNGTDRVKYIVNGVELGDTSLTKGGARDGTRTLFGGLLDDSGNVKQGTTGYIKDVEISKNSVALFSSSLTDKDAGAVQPSSVGGFTAELIGYNESVWANIYDADPLYMEGRDVDIIILAGQSNQVGRAVRVNGVDNVYPLGDLIVQWDVYAQSPASAINELQFNESKGANNGMSQWLEFVNTLNPLRDDPTRSILLIPVACGGTGFATNDWNKGDKYYDDMIATLSNVYGTVGGGSKVLCVSWIQGENDADAMNDNYLQDLTQMSVDLESDSSLVDSSTPWVVVQIGGSLEPSYVPIINADLAEFVNNRGNSAIVDTSDLTLQDTWHFDAPSLRTIGQRSANALAGLQ